MVRMALVGLLHHGRLYSDSDDACPQTYGELLKHFLDMIPVADVRSPDRISIKTAAHGHGVQVGCRLTAADYSSVSIWFLCYLLLIRKNHF